MKNIIKNNLNLATLLGISLMMFVTNVQAEPINLCGDGVGGLPSAWIRGESELYYLINNVGIGTSTPTERLEVEGVVKATSFKHGNQDLDDRYINTGQANSITSSMIVDGTVSGADINSAQVQRRVSDTCPAGSAIRIVNSTGTVSCQSVGSGTITGVNSGSGLTGGGTSGTVTLAVGAGAIQGSHIANGAIGSDKIDVNAVQRRVSGTCSSGQYMQSITNTGAVNCTTPNLTAGVPKFHLQTAATTGNSGSVSRSFNFTPTFVQINFTNVTGAEAGFSWIILSGQTNQTFKADMGSQNIKLENVSLQGSNLSYTFSCSSCNSPLFHLIAWTQ